MYADEQQLVKFLLDSGLVSRAQVAEVTRRAELSGDAFSRELTQSGLLDEDELRKIIARGAGIPFVTLSIDDIAPEALVSIPEPFSRTHNMVAYALGEGVLEVALLDVADAEHFAALRPAVSHRARFRLTDRASMKRALLTYQKVLKDGFGRQLADTVGRVSPLSDMSEDALRAAAESPEAASVVDALLQHALAQHASDIHLEPTEQGLLVRYRIGGALHDAMLLPGAAALSIVARLKLLARLAVVPRGAAEGRFKVVVGDAALTEQVSIKVAAMSAEGRERVVLQLIRESLNRRGFSLETYGLHGEQLEQVHRALQSTAGLILVSGPAGSGKTTLLYTLMDMLSGTGRSLATIEGSIEARLSGVTQTATDAAAGITLASGLRGLLRHDPDVIMVGLIKDSETASLAVAAANRGMLVLAAIEAPDACHGIARMQALGVSPLQLASTLRMAIGTRVVRRLCAQVRASHRLSRLDIDTIERYADLGRVLSTLKDERSVARSVAWKDLVFSRPEACAVCADGYHGHLGLVEVLPTSLTLKELIVHEADAGILADEAHEEGMLTLGEDGIAKAALGLTTIDEVVRVME